MKSKYFQYILPFNYEKISNYGIFLDFTYDFLREKLNLSLDEILPIKVFVWKPKQFEKKWGKRFKDWGGAVAHNKAMYISTKILNSKEVKEYTSREWLYSVLAHELCHIFTGYVTEDWSSWFAEGTGNLSAVEATKHYGLETVSRKEFNHLLSKTTADSANFLFTYYLFYKYGWNIFNYAIHQVKKRGIDFSEKTPREKNEILLSILFNYREVNE